MRFLVLFLLLKLAAPAASAQQPAATAAPTSFYTSYTYLGYTIQDRGLGPKPVAARDVGGTLSFAPDGTYRKHLTVGGNVFDQQGRFVLRGNQIELSYTNAQGQTRQDRGTFTLRNQVLTLRMEAYPAGNVATYTLRQASARQ